MFSNMLSDVLEAPIGWDDEVSPIDEESLFDILSKRASIVKITRNDTPKWGRVDVYEFYYEGTPHVVAFIRDRDSLPIEAGWIWARTSLVIAISEMELLGQEMIPGIKALFGPVVYRKLLQQADRL